MALKLKQALVLGSLLVTGGVAVRVLYGKLGKTSVSERCKESNPPASHLRRQKTDIDAHRAHMDKIGVAARAAYLILGEELKPATVKTSALSLMTDGDIALLLAAGVSSTIYPEDAPLLFGDTSLRFVKDSCEFTKLSSGKPGAVDLAVLTLHLENIIKDNQHNPTVVAMETYFQRLTLLMKDAQNAA